MPKKADSAALGRSPALQEHTLDSLVATYPQCMELAVSLNSSYP